MVRPRAGATSRHKLHACNMGEETFTGSVTRFLEKSSPFLESIHCLFFYWSVKELGEVALDFLIAGTCGDRW